jgi:hypothetical protein
MDVKNMDVKTYSDGISRDAQIYGDNVYFSEGQGCDTIWFTTVPEARGQAAQVCQVCRDPEELLLPKRQQPSDYS